MDYVTAEAEKLGMAEFEAANRSLAQHLFSAGGADGKDKEMLDYILSSGVYGNLSNRGGKRDTRKTGESKPPLYGAPSLSVRNLKDG